MKKLLLLALTLFSLGWYGTPGQAQFASTPRRPTSGIAPNVYRDLSTGLIMEIGRLGDPRPVTHDTLQFVPLLTTRLNAARTLSDKKYKPAGYKPNIDSVSGLRNQLTNMTLGLGGKADTSLVYPKTVANQRFLDRSYRPNWVTGIDGLPAYYPTNRAVSPDLDTAIANRATKAQVAALYAGGARDSTAYTKTQSRGLFAQKGTTLADYEIQNALTRNEVESRLTFSSIRDLAAAGGYTLSTSAGVDNRAAIQYAVDHPGPSNGARLPVGTYYVSGPIDIQGGRQVVFDFGAQIRVMNDFAAESLAGNDGRYVLRVRGPNVRLDNVQIDSQGLKAAPIMLLFADDVTVSGCQLKNWRLGGLGQPGIAVLASNRARLLNNTLVNGEHGATIYRSDGTIVQGNFVDVMLHGGIYTAFTSNFTALANIIKNCGDVGADSEGGANNTWIANFVTRCKNGELTIFSGANSDTYVSHHLIFRGNTVIREAQYTTMNATGTTSSAAGCDPVYGACSFMSLDEGCYETGFENNTITANFGLAFFHEQLGDKNDRHVFFRNNHVTATGATFFRCLNSDGLTLDHNVFVGGAGTAGMQNEFRDGHNARISYNEFRFESPKTGGYAILLNTSDAVNPGGADYATIGAMVDHNTFVKAGEFAYQDDHFQNSSLITTLWANDFGTTYTANGGLDVTANSQVRLRDQKLKIRLSEGNTNLANINPIARFGAGFGVGYLSFGWGGYNGTVAQVSLSHQDNGELFVGAQTLLQRAFLNVSASGSTLQLSNTTGSPAGTAEGKFDATLNSN